MQVKKSFNLTKSPWQITINLSNLISYQVEILKILKYQIQFTFFLVELPFTVATSQFFSVALWPPLFPGHPDDIFNMHSTDN